MQGVSTVLSRSPTQRPHQMTPGDATVETVRCRRLRACFCDRHSCALFWSVWVAGRRRWPGPTQGLELCGCFNPPAHDRTDARRGEFYSCPFPPCRLS